MTTKSSKEHFGIFTTFLLHLHPPMVDQRAIKFSRTFGLGGINALLFVILAITGVLLRFTYMPSPELAYESILSLQNHSLLGGLIRNIHHWSAKLMVITSFLHLLRVFYSQSVFNERKRNWYYGLLLFALVLAFNFTGYLLPWDQLSYWAVTIVSNMPAYIPMLGDGLAHFIRGGDSVDGHTLLNFYNLHTAIFPLFFVVLVSLHFYLVRKAKGVTVTAQEDKKMVKVYPNLVIREALVGLILVFIVMLLAIFFKAPLLDYANPLLSPDPIKAPWYFAGMQELLIHIHPVLAVFIIPLGFVAFLIWIPFVGISSPHIGQWFYSSKGKALMMHTSLGAAVFTFILILLLDYYIRPLSAHWPALLSGLFPFILYLITMGSLFLLLRTKYKANINESIQSIFSMLISSYVVLSLVSIYLRGIHMALIF